MLHSGLCSITFRQLSAEEIVGLVAKTGVEGIEWGGDVHVPHGDTDRAAEVRAMTVDAGVRVASYGSYYRVGHEEPVAFERVLDSAVALQTPLVRVWAGKQGSAAADEAYWTLLVNESRRIADLAQQAGIAVAYEFHANTLTDSNESALKLLRAVDHANVKSYWQIMTARPREYNLDGLRSLMPWLTNVHAFHWGADNSRRPLAPGEEAWRQYLVIAAEAAGEHWVMLEFVKDNTPEQFLEDGRTLRRWIEENIWE